MAKRSFVENVTATGTEGKKPSKWNEPIPMGSDSTLPAEAQAQIDMLEKSTLPAETIRAAVEGIKAKATQLESFKAELVTNKEDATADPFLKIYIGKTQFFHKLETWRALLSKANAVTKKIAEAETLLAATK